MLVLKHPIGRVTGRKAYDDRDSYPAGHPVTWGAISNEKYPYPVFDKSERLVNLVLTRKISQNG